MFQPTLEVIPPPRPLNHEGSARRIGIEVEFAGLSARDAARTIASSLGGTLVEIDRHRFDVRDTELGDFRTELDSRFAHPEGVLPTIDGETPEWLRRLGEIVSGSIGDTGALVIPCEVVAPPIEITKIGRLDELLRDLRNAGATGTDSSIFYAFGVHLNPEIASKDPAWLLAILRAQILLSAWLRSIMAIDVSRYLTGFATTFGDAYIERILQPDYQPDLSTLIDDYLLHNPTRDRELDMLPLFAWSDQERVRRALPNVKIGRRPTLHYRLPNAALERSAWSITLEWNRWCLIERLAQDSETLNLMARAYFDTRRRGLSPSWAGYSSEWLAHALHRYCQQTP